MLKYCLRAYRRDTKFIAQVVCPVDDLLDTINQLSKLDDGHAVVKGFILDEKENGNDN